MEMVEADRAPVARRIGGRALTPPTGIAVIGVDLPAMAMMMIAADRAPVTMMIGTATIGVDLPAIATMMIAKDRPVRGTMTMDVVGTVTPAAMLKPHAADGKSVETTTAMVVGDLALVTMTIARHLPDLAMTMIGAATIGVDLLAIATMMIAKDRPVPGTMTMDVVGTVTPAAMLKPHAADGKSVETTTAMVVGDLALVTMTIARHLPDLAMTMIGTATIGVDLLAIATMMIAADRAPATMMIAKDRPVPGTMTMDVVGTVTPAAMLKPHAADGKSADTDAL
jgi:hypothetical protein